jgi:urea transport system substrate-binding protein
MSQPASTEPIRLGLLHSLTGTMAISEAVLLDSERLAIDEINAAGGVLGRRIEPLVADGASSPETFARRASELLAAGATSLFGCWTSASRKAVKPLIEAVDGLLWYPVHYEGLEESQHIIYVGACLNQQTIPAIEWALANIGRRIFLVGTDHVFSRTASRLARSLVEAAALVVGGLQGACILGESYLPFGMQDFTAVISAIRDAQPDLVFNTMNGDCNPAFYRQYHAAGIKARELPILSVSVSESELYPIADVAAGHLACWPYFQTLDNRANHEFVAKFKDVYGADRVCSAPMVMAYCQIHLWRQAVEAAGSLATDDVRRSLLGREFLGPAGRMVIELNHHVNTNAYVGRCGHDGQFDIVWRSPGPIAPLPWLGIEQTGLPYAALVREAMASYPEVLDYATRLEQKIREREDAAEALRLSDERFRVALQSSPVSMSHQDRELRYIWAHHPSPPFSLVDLLGRTDADLFAPAEAALLTDVKQRVLDSGVGERVEVALTVGGLPTFWDLTTEPLRDARGNVVGVTCASLDVTERRCFEDALRESLEMQVRAQTESLLESNSDLAQRATQLQHLATELTLTEERERRQLGAVLHDNVQQLLVGALMHTEALLRQTAHEPVRASGQRVRDIITEAVAATRSLTWGLSPPVLYQIGLGAALHGLTQHSFAQYGLHVTFIGDPDAEPHAEAVKVLLFRAVQELLLNIVKHAKVESAEVCLSLRAPDTVQIEVTDEGVGFDPAAGREDGDPTGFGLVSLRERLEHLGGRVEVQSAPGAGTSVLLMAPLNGRLPKGGRSDS